MKKKSPIDQADETITIKVLLPENLIDTVRKKAKKLGIPYQRFIRLAFERMVEG